MLCYVYFTTVLKIKKRRGKTIKMIMAGLYKVPPTHLKGPCPFIPLRLLSTWFMLVNQWRELQWLLTLNSFFNCFMPNPPNKVVLGFKNNNNTMCLSEIPGLNWGGGESLRSTSENWDQPESFTVKHQKSQGSSPPPLPLCTTLTLPILSPQPCSPHPTSTPSE